MQIFLYLANKILFVGGKVQAHGKTKLGVKKLKIMSKESTARLMTMLSELEKNSSGLLMILPQPCLRAVFFTFYLFYCSHLKILVDFFFIFIKIKDSVKKVMKEYRKNHREHRVKNISAASL